MSAFSAYRRQLRERAIDAVVVLVVLWLSLAQFGSQSFGEYDEVATDPDGLGFALVVAVALPLFWRRRAPWPAFAATLVPSVALVSLGYAIQIHAGPAVAIYTLAARSDRRDVGHAIGAAAIAYVTLVAVETVTLRISLEDYLFPAVLWIAAWLVGDRRRTARQRADEAQERSERERRLALAEERTGLARDLHDSAGHALNNILIQAGAARVLLERDPKRSREALTAVEEVARETLTDIERIVGILREDDPAERAPLSGTDAIPALVERHRAAGLDFRLRLRGEATRPIPQPVDRAGYRIAQEALTNAARHGTGSAEITVERERSRLEIEVENPAPVDALPAPGGGRGILGMRERVELLGGTLETDADAERFRVRAVLPYERPPR